MTNAEAWHLWNKDLESSQKFIDFAWMGGNAAALERRVWMTGGSYDDSDSIFPPLFFLFCGPPAAGKSRAAVKVWEALSRVRNPDTTKTFFKAPDNASAAALLRKLSQSRKEVSLEGEKDPYIYYAMFIISEEFGNLIKTGDTDTANTLIQMFDGRGFDKETITSDSFDIQNLAVNLIACTTPDWVKDSFTESLVSQGLFSRFIPVFADGPRFIRDARHKSASQNEARDQIVAHWAKLSQLKGRIEFTEEAYKLRDEIIPTKKYLQDRVDGSSRADSYYSRKRIAWFKLWMALHFSESTDMVLGRKTGEQSYQMLTDNETEMSRIYAGLAANPMAKHYENVLDFITLNKGASMARICRHFWRELSKRDVDEVLEHLLTTKQVFRNGDNIELPPTRRQAIKTVHDMKIPNLDDHLGRLKGAGK